MPDEFAPAPAYYGAGRVRAVMGSGQPPIYCSYVVKREGNGSGVVTVTNPDGNTRDIFFTNGRATGADTSEGAAGAFSASKEGHLNLIDIGEERYAIPNVVIYGG